LLRELGASLKAFLDDLERAGESDRVVVLVFSEFGRRLGENGSGGTDHLPAVSTNHTARANGSRQQELQVLAREVLDDAAVVGAQDGVGQIAFLLLQFQDLLLDGASADQPVGEDVLGLTDAV